MLIGYLMAKWAASIGFFFTMLWGYNWQMMVGWSAGGFTTLDKPWELVSRESGTGFVRLQHDIKWLLILSTSYCGYKQQFRVQSPTELWKKIKRFNLQAPPVYDRKVTNLFFFHNYFFHNYFFFHNSVGDCMSINSQIECILRGNIEL